MSTDNGLNFDSIGAYIPDIPCLCLFIHPDNPAVMYLGTDLGLYYSENSGQSWINIDYTGLPTVTVSWMAYQAASETLFLFTYGRGVWTVNIPTTVFVTTATPSAQATTAWQTTGQVTTGYQTTTGGLATSTSSTTHSLRQTTGELTTGRLTTAAAPTTAIPATTAMEGTTHHGLTTGRHTTGQFAVTSTSSKSSTSTKSSTSHSTSSGSTQQQSIVNVQPSSPVNSVVIGCAAGAVGLVCICAILCIVCRRRRKNTARKYTFDTQASYGYFPHMQKTGSNVSQWGWQDKNQGL